MIPHGQSIPGESATTHPLDLLSMPEAAAELHPPIKPRSWYKMVQDGRAPEADKVRNGHGWWYRQTVEAVDAARAGRGRGRAGGAKDKTPRRDRLGEIHAKLQEDPDSVTLEWIVSEYRGVNRTQAAELLEMARRAPSVRVRTVQEILPEDPADDEEVVRHLTQKWKISRTKAEDLVRQAREAL